MPEFSDKPSPAYQEVVWQERHINESGSGLSVDCRRTPLACVFQRIVGPPGMQEHVFECIFANPAQKNDVTSLWVDWHELERSLMRSQTETGEMWLYDQRGYKVYIHVDEAALAEFRNLASTQPVNYVNYDQAHEGKITRYDSGSVLVTHERSTVEISLEPDEKGNQVYSLVAAKYPDLKIKIGRVDSVFMRLLVTADRYYNQPGKRNHSDIFMGSHLLISPDKLLNDIDLFLPVSTLHELAALSQNLLTPTITRSELTETKIDLLDSVVKQWHTIRSSALQAEMTSGVNYVSVILFALALLSGACLGTTSAALSVVDAIGDLNFDLQLVGIKVRDLLCLGSIVIPFAGWILGATAIQIKSELQKPGLKSHADSGQQDWDTWQSYRRAFRSNSIKMIFSGLWGKS